MLRSTSGVEMCPKNLLSLILGPLGESFWSRVGAQINAKFGNHKVGILAVKNNSQIDAKHTVLKPRAQKLKAPATMLKPPRDHDRACFTLARLPPSPQIISTATRAGTYASLWPRSQSDHRHRPNSPPRNRAVPCRVVTQSRPRPHHRGPDPEVDHGTPASLRAQASALQ